MGVLKVYDGTTWKKTGCGGAGGTVGRLKLWDGTQWVREKCDNDATVGTFADRTATCSSTMSGPIKYVGTWPGGQVPIPSEPPIPSSGVGAWRYIVVPPGTSVVNVCDLAEPAVMAFHDTGGSYGYWTDTTTAPAGWDTYVFSHDFLSGFPPSPTPGPGDTSNPNQTAPVARPLRMWDGTTWQQVACMVPA